MMQRSLLFLGWVCVGACAPMDGFDSGDGSMSEFVLTSTAFEEGGSLPADLSCVRDGGDGVSPPLAWGGAPSKTASYAVVIYHYPVGTTPGVDEPSHYWLLWGVPSSITSLSRGNVEQVGFEGSDKDGVSVGYSPPCSPSGSGVHTYTVKVFALSTAPTALGTSNDASVGYDDFIAAIAPITLATDEISFTHGT